MGETYQRNDGNGIGKRRLHDWIKCWNDDAFVRAQARERFGYVRPGETAYVVLDEDGEPIETRSELHDPGQVLREPPEAWWQDAWSSVELAGNPPKQRGLAPASELDAPGE